MNIGTFEHLSSSLAEFYGLRWYDRKLALKDLGPADQVHNLFFVSDHSRRETEEFLYLINRVELSTELAGRRVKPRLFHFSPSMVEHLQRLKPRLCFISVNDELVRVKEFSMTQLSRWLNIVIDPRGEPGFIEDHLYHTPIIKQQYLPRRGKKKKLVW